MKWKVFNIFPYWRHHHHHHHCASSSFKFSANIRNSNRKKLLKHEFGWWVNENEIRLLGMWISCTLSVACDTYMNMSLTWDDFSICAHETKWENYYSKPHDENARISYISIIAICWIYIITQGAAWISQQHNRQCASPPLTYDQDHQGFEQTNHSVRWNAKSSHLHGPHTRVSSLIWFTHIGGAYVLFCGYRPPASKINTQSHVWMGRCEPSGASVAVHIRTRKIHRTIHIAKRTLATAAQKLGYY